MLIARIGFPDKQNVGKIHSVKYARIDVFSELYFPVQVQIRRLQEITVERKPLFWHIFCKYPFI